MTTRERFHAVMNFQPFDRLPILEWASWWDKTIERWHAEGLPATLKDRYDICRYFGLDVYWQDWFPARQPTCPAPASHGAPLIESLADYEALRPHLFPSPDQLGAHWPAWERAAHEDAVLWFTLEGFFWFPRPAAFSRLFAEADQHRRASVVSCRLLPAAAGSGDRRRL